MFHAYAPNGKRIVGTLEKIYAAALIGGFGKTSADSLLYTGTTSVWWDSQESVTRRVPPGESIVFLDEDCDEWLEGQLTFRENETLD